MKVTKKVLVVTAISLAFISLVFSCNYYKEFKHNYFVAKEEIYVFEDLAYDLDNLGDDFYTLGTIVNSDYQIMTDINEAQNFYELFDKKVYNFEDRVKFFSLLRDCSFEPIDSFQGFCIYMFSSQFNNLASFTGDINILRKNSDCFSRKAYDYMLNTKDTGILYADIIKVFGDLYLLANIDIEFSYNEYYKELYPDPETMKFAVFKINAAENQKKLLIQGIFKGNVGDLYFG